MPIFLAIVRRAWCCVCNETFDLEGSEEAPEQCRVCGSRDWEWGPEQRGGVMIRQGIDRMRRPLNRGAKSRKRQQQGRRQYQKFKPKEISGEE